jgi:hypothetical protein
MAFTFVAPLCWRIAVMVAAAAGELKEPLRRRP